MGQSEAKPPSQTTELVTAGNKPLLKHGYSLWEMNKLPNLLFWQHLPFRFVEHSVFDMICNWSTWKKYVCCWIWLENDSKLYINQLVHLMTERVLDYGTITAYFKILINFTPFLTCCVRSHEYKYLDKGTITFNRNSQFGLHWQKLRICVCRVCLQNWKRVND